MLLCMQKFMMSPQVSQKMNKARLRLMRNQITGLIQASENATISDAAKLFPSQPSNEGLIFPPEGSSQVWDIGELVDVDTGDKSCNES